MVLLFLADYRDERLREAIGAWLGGGLTPLAADEGRGRALLADELVALSFNDLLRFYGLPAEPPKEETA